MALRVVILAAGQGTRMRSQVPKVLHLLAGRPLLQHVVNAAVQLQPEQLVIVHGAAGALLKAQVRDPAVEWVEQTQALGTGHAVQQALPCLGTDANDYVLVLYADVPAIHPETLEAMLVKAAAGAEVVVLSAQVAEPKGLGRILRTADGSLCGIVEERDASPAQREITEVNSGLVLFRLGLLQSLLPQLHTNNAQGEYYLTDVIHLAQTYGCRLGSVVCDGAEVQGINDRCQLAQVERYWQRLQAQQCMLNGVSLADPTRFDVRGELITAADVFIDVNCIFEGRVQLAEGVSIGANCWLKDAELAAGVTVHANTMIEGARIDAGASIGPFARIRPHSTVGTAAHIGNFVELKKTHFGAHSKASHLAYLGDAQVGEHVNIGAGVITCNYDGARKHTTYIEDAVFIGADSQLVAPIRVSRGATVGAGSTITRDVPPDSLTLSRAPQVSRESWSRPQKDAVEQDEN